MKKRVFLILLSLLCLISTAALAVDIKIPATAADAAKLAPAPLPDAPSYTAEDHGDAVQYYLTGLENWPLKNAARYEKGAFQTVHADKDGLSAIPGKEEEPFSFLVFKEMTEHPMMTPSSKKYKSLVLAPDLDWNIMNYKVHFPKDVSYVLNSQGNVARYSFKSGKYRVVVDYDPQGWLWKVDCHKDGFMAEYDASGALVSLDLWGKQSYSYDGEVWRDDDYQICEKPSKFSMKDIPVLVLTPEESAALIAERVQASNDCLPQDPSLVAGEDLSQFAPAPVLEETDDGETVQLTITGLEAWGFGTQFGFRLENDGVYEAIYYSRLPELPEDTVIVRFPTSMREQGRMSAVLQSRYGDRRGFISYRSWLDAWEFSYQTDNGDSCSFVLGENPSLLEWTCHVDGRIYTHDLQRGTHSEGYSVGGKDVEFVYFEDELIEITAVQLVIDGPGTIRAFYHPDGRLSTLVIEGIPYYEYSAADDQWICKDRETKAEVPCEQPEGFAMDEWATVPPCE